MRVSPTSGTVFISGNFNVLHAGHIRLFAFARNFGKKLIVGVISDRLAADSAYIEESLRLEAVRTNSWVQEAILVDEPIETLLRKLQPAVVVKGREFEDIENVEAKMLSIWGGRLIFGSSELPLSSLNMIKQELASSETYKYPLPASYIRQHRISVEDMATLVSRFQGLRVCVIGDLIVDEYISCESLGMSQEDPSLVVTPFDNRRFLGGAGIVAAHAAALGASSSLITVIGDDESGRFAEEILKEYGVSCNPTVDDSRPTTLKKRYRSEGKTLLRVSHLNQSSVSPDLQERIYKSFTEAIQECDLVVFSDFNYGCLPTRLIDRCVVAAESQNILCVADSQCSSQVGDVSRFRHMELISATEREVRISLRDNDDGLTVIAERLRLKAGAKSVMVKLGAEGVLLHMQSSDGRVITNQLPALNPNPVDVAGAGDSMLIATGLALAASGSPWEAAALGSITAALQVSRLGNIPISAPKLITALKGL